MDNNGGSTTGNCMLCPKHIRKMLTCFTDGGLTGFDFENDSRIGGTTMGNTRPVPWLQAVRYGHSVVWAGLASRQHLTNWQMPTHMMVGVIVPTPPMMKLHMMMGSWCSMVRNQVPVPDMVAWPGRHPRREPRKWRPPCC